MTKAVQDVQVAVRMPNALVGELDRWVEASHSSRAELIREALTAHLRRLEAERDADIYDAMPFTDHELSPGRTAGVLSTIPPWDETDDWSSTAVASSSDDR